MWDLVPQTWHLNFLKLHYSKKLGNPVIFSIWIGHFYQMGFLDRKKFCTNLRDFFLSYSKIILSIHKNVQYVTVIFLSYFKMIIFHLSENSVPFWNRKKSLSNVKQFSSSRKKFRFKQEKIFGSSRKIFWFQQEKIRFKQEKKSSSRKNFYKNYSKRKSSDLGLNQRPLASQTDVLPLDQLGLLKMKGKNLKLKLKFKS